MLKKGESIIAIDFETASTGGIINNVSLGYEICGILMCASFMALESPV